MVTLKRNAFHPIFPKRIVQKLSLRMPILETQVLSQKTHRAFMLSSFHLHLGCVLRVEEFQDSGLLERCVDNYTYDVLDN